MSAHNNNTRCWAVVPAAGVGQRMKADRPKQYLHLLNTTVLEQALQRLWDSGLFEKIVVAISTDDGYWPDLEISRQDWLIQADGGQHRADSVLSGLQMLGSLAEADDWVFVHDAARPCIMAIDILNLSASIEEDSIGGILALPVHDTLKLANQNRIADTVDRSRVWRALTPQAFRYQQLKQALLDATEAGVTVTDEASAIEFAGFNPLLIEGRTDNIKITRPEDLELARFYLERQACE
ncbi:MAG: 2-C-methyl-D-erythritol 4-phosphate cytidylyltransferase [Gammaproteobacteria bacterium]|nr:2-C-methyl-D-erythritol 4-phosphate cytidylyltransferase [Gammaproteobacteria bacterium]